MKKYIAFDLGEQQKGAVVEITLSARAHVRLMDARNHDIYVAGGPYTFYGELVKLSPYDIVVPFKAHWYLIVDNGELDGKLVGKVEASVRIRSR